MTIDFNFIKENINPYIIFEDNKLSSYFEKEPFKAYKENGQYKIYYKGRTFTLINLLTEYMQLPIKDVNKELERVFYEHYKNTQNIQKINGRLDKLLDNKPKKVKTEKDIFQINNKTELMIHSFTLMHPAPILDRLGYHLKEAKSSKYTLVFRKKDENGNVDFVMFKRLPNRQYIYKGANDKDKGNIINFLMSRLSSKNGKKINRMDIISFMQKEVKPVYSKFLKERGLKHLPSKPVKYGIKTVLKENGILKNLMENDKKYKPLTEDNYLTKRGISFNTLKHFKRQLKENRYKSIVYVTYNFNGNIGDFVRGSLNIKINKFETPDFPMKNVSIGITQGISIFEPENLNQRKNILLSESFIDGLSFFELEKLSGTNPDIKNYVFLSTEGAVDKNKLNTFREYVKKYKNEIKNIKVLLDGDFYGNSFKNILKEFIDTEKELFNSIKIEFITPVSEQQIENNKFPDIKDFNDVLLNKLGKTTVSEINNKEKDKKKKKMKDISL